METESRLRVPPLTVAERAELDALAASASLLTVTIPRHILAAVLDRVDEESGRHGKVLQAHAEALQSYAELDEAHAATLGELCGCSFDLVDARSRVEVLEGLLRELEAWMRLNIPGAPEPLTPEIIEAFAENRRRIEQCGVKLEPTWEDRVFEGLELPRLEQQRAALELAHNTAPAAPPAHDFLEQRDDVQRDDIRIVAWLRRLADASIVSLAHDQIALDHDRKCREAMDWLDRVIARLDEDAR